MTHDSDGNKVKTLDIMWRHTRKILERVTRDEGNATGWLGALVSRECKIEPASNQSFFFALKIKQNCWMKVNRLL